MGGGGIMGDRAYIQVEAEGFKTPITFYGHWSGEDNILAVRNVLSRTGRVGDASYLAAQIFYEFATLGNYDGELSFGIDNYGDDPDGGWTNNPTVYVNADTGVYRYKGETFTEFAKVESSV